MTLHQFFGIMKHEESDFDIGDGVDSVGM